jgi:hypothetical protein
MSDITPECWLCEGLRGVAVHALWSERRGKTLLTPHEYPTGDDHPTYPCPMCALADRDAKSADVLDAIRSMPLRYRPEDVAHELEYAEFRGALTNSVVAERDALREQLAQAQAKAWDEGYSAAEYMAKCWGHTDSWEDEPANPYRAALGDHPEPDQHAYLESASYWKRAVCGALAFGGSASGDEHRCTLTPHRGDHADETYGWAPGRHPALYPLADRGEGT